LIAILLLQVESSTAMKGSSFAGYNNKQR